MARKIIKSAELREMWGGISNTTMHRHIASGILPKPFKIGKVNGWYLDDLEAAMENLSQSAK